MTRLWMVTLLLVGCANAAPTQSPGPGPTVWPTTERQTAVGCYDEQAGFAPDVAECHPYLGPWDSCDAPDPSKDVYDTCSGNAVIETDGSGRHQHDGTEDAFQVDCSTWCDEQLGWDGCTYAGACTTEAISCQGGTVAAGYCSCTQGGPKKQVQNVIGECVRVCCDVNGELNWITADYCEKYGGTNLGEDVEDCF